MESTSCPGNSHEIRSSRSGPINVTDFENRIIDELNQERLRQSRIIARQHETIGKLNRALEQWTERDSRRGSFFHSSSSFKLPPISPPPDLGFIDASAQTDITIGDEIYNAEEMRRMMGVISAENRKLLSQNREVDQALYHEREKTKRMLAVCTKISCTSPTESERGGLTSPILAKWISLGLDDFSYSIRSRVGTVDEAYLRLPSPMGYSNIRRSCMSHGSPFGSPSHTPDSSPKKALSEGDSPNEGVDLDIMYGSFEPSTMMPKEAVALTPRAADSGDIKFLRSVAGTFVMGQLDPSTPSSLKTVILRLGPHRGIPLRCKLPDTCEDVTITGSCDQLIATISSTGEKISGDFSTSKITWNESSVFYPRVWSRVPDSLMIVGEWWTGFCILLLSPSDDMSGTSRGKWGSRFIELRLVEKLMISDEWLVGGVLGTSGPSRIKMHGSLRKKIGGNNLWMIEWGNGQVWEQITH
jgi:hypothetical protein